jgi:HK97 family phage major capsid protein
MNVKEQLAAALKRAQELSKSAGERDLTDAEELTEVKSLTDNIDGLKAQVKKADDDFALLKRLGDLGRPQAKAADEADMPALTLGEHFVKHAGERLKANRGTPGASASAPEWFGAKASTTTQDTTGSGWTPVLTEVDRTIVRGVRTRLTIADLLGSGTISGNADLLLRRGRRRGRVHDRRRGGRQAAAPHRRPDDRSPTR